jgi:uncharacterized OB-fold protein
MQAIKPGIFTTDDPTVKGTALRGTRCRNCAEVFFPPRKVCLRCRTMGTLEPVRLSMRGRIVAITHAMRVPAHYGHDYFLAEIDLAEDVRIRCQARLPADAPPAIGDSVELSVEPLFTTPAGVEVYGYAAHRVHTKEAR